MPKKLQKTFLVCPLDWGIGHATRCVPIINYLLLKKQKVIIGGYGRSFLFLQNEFPRLEHINIPGFKVSYAANEKTILKLLKAMPAFLRSIRKENHVLKQIIDQKNIDVVISDNRYGLYSKSIPSVLITHQVMLAAPSGFRFFEAGLSKITRFFMQRFHECWIPDFEGKENLSGKLSHRFSLPANTRFIGPLSRFFEIKGENKIEKNNDLLVMISGPEPQREIFEKKIMNQLEGYSMRTVILLGKTESRKPYYGIRKNRKVYNHLNTREIFEQILSSRIIICRSGYSTLMDLYATGKKAVLVPTPGQTEQQYLAAYHQQVNDFPVFTQKELDIQKILKTHAKMEWDHEPYQMELMNLAINSLMDD